MIQILPLIVVTAAVLLVHVPATRRATDKISAQARAWSNAAVAGVGTMAFTASITAFGVEQALSLLLSLLPIPMTVLVIYWVWSSIVLDRPFSFPRPLTLVLIVCATAGNLLALVSFEQYLAAIALVFTGILVRVARSAVLRGRADSILPRTLPPSASTGYLQ